MNLKLNKYRCERNSTTHGNKKTENRKRWLLKIKTITCLKKYWYTKKTGKKTKDMWLCGRVFEREFDTKKMYWSSWKN